MIRYLSAAALALLASPVVANTVPIVDGPLTVHTGDVLTSGKAVQNTPVDGIITCVNGTCPNRMGRGTFTMSGGATKLRVLTKPNVGYQAGGFTYQVLDGTPATVAPVAPVLSTPPVLVSNSIAAHVTNPFGISIAGCATAASLCPNQDDVDWYTAPAQGFELVRLSFHDTTDANAVRSGTNAFLAKGATVVLDRHDYKWPAVTDQVAWWSSFAALYKANTKVVISLMNEPRGFDDPVVTNDWVQWAADTKAIIAGLRANGFQNTIAVQWPGSSAAFRFDKSEPSYKACESAMCAVDRQGGLGDANVLFEDHAYWDHGSTGTNPNCEPFFFLDATRAAAEKRGYMLLQGELAAGSHNGVKSTCQPLLDRAIAEFKSHPKTWFGVTWWGGGRDWKESYIFKIEPTKGTRANVPHSAYLEQLRGR